MREEMQELKRRVQGRERKELRERMGENVIVRDRRYRVGKVKRYLMSMLGRGGGDGAVKRLVVTGEGGEREVLSDPAEVNKYMVGFYEEWMGRGRDRWFRVGEGDRREASVRAAGWVRETEEASKKQWWVHPMYVEGEEGKRVRKLIDEGRSGEVEMPDKVRRVAEECERVKKKGGEKVMREDYTWEGVEIDEEITRTEWQGYWRRKGWRKMGGRSGLRNAQVKALVEGGGEWGEWLRRITNLSITAELPCEQWLTEVYYSIPKVQGCMEVDKMRPLKFLEVLRKAAMGILNNRMGRGIERMGLLQEMQSAFRVGRGTAVPLLVSNLLCEHAMAHKEELHMEFLDAKRAYDSVECTVGKEMMLRRMGVGERYIRLMRMCEANNVMLALTGGGYSDEVGESVGRTDIGLGQGHEEAPQQWNLIGDVYNCMQVRHAQQPAVMATRGGREERVWGQLFADDTQLTNATREGGVSAMRVMAECDAFFGISRASHKGWHTALKWRGGQLEKELGDGERVRDGVKEVRPVEEKEEEEREEEVEGEEVGEMVPWLPPRAG